MAPKRSEGANLTKIIAGLKRQIISLGQLHYQSQKDTNFKEWRERTLYLLKLGFGGGKEYEDVDDAIEKMPEKDDTEGRYTDNERYKYWLEDEDGSDDGEEGKFNEDRWKKDYTDAKNWIQRLLKLRIEELELLTTESSVPERPRGSKNVQIATQVVDVKIDLSTEVNHLVGFVHENEPDPSKAKEAEEKIRALESELKQKSSRWSEVKELLIWIANYSKDLFLKALPIILAHYGIK